MNYTCIISIALFGEYGREAARLGSVRAEDGGAHVDVPPINTTNKYSQYSRNTTTDTYAY